MRHFFRSKSRQTGSLHGRELNGDLRRLRFENLEDRRLLAVFTVNSTDDVDDGTADASHTSLREAINAANSTSGFDTIEFDIPGVGPHTIQPTTELPAITDPVIIDGYTQPGAMPNTNSTDLGTNAVIMIELDGTFAGTANGLVITGGGTTVRGLAINRFDADGEWAWGFNDGIFITGLGGNKIAGNFLGTDVTGTIPLGNGDVGVFINGGSTSNNVVGGLTPASRNLISANLHGGVQMREESDGNIVQGKGSKLLAHVEDVNSDGLDDLVLQVETENLDAGAFQDGIAILTGETFGGETIEGSDSIVIVPLNE